MASIKVLDSLRLIWPWKYTRNWRIFLLLILFLVCTAKALPQVGTSPQKLSVVDQNDNIQHKKKSNGNNIEDETDKISNFLRLEDLKSPIFYEKFIPIIFKFNLPSFSSYSSVHRRICGDVDVMANKKSKVEEQSYNIDVNNPGHYNMSSFIDSLTPGIIHSSTSNPILVSKKSQNQNQYQPSSSSPPLFEGYEETCSSLRNLSKIFDALQDTYVPLKQFQVEIGKMTEKEFNDISCEEIRPHFQHFKISLKNFHSYISRLQQYCGWDDLDLKSIINSNLNDESTNNNNNNNNRDSSDSETFSSETLSSGSSSSSNSGSSGDEFENVLRMALKDSNVNMSSIQELAMNAYLVMQQSSILQLQSERSKWVDAFTDCRSHLIPRALIDQTTLTSSLISATKKLTVDKLGLSIPLTLNTEQGNRNESDSNNFFLYYNLPLTDCVLIEEKYFLVRLLIPVLSARTNFNYKLIQTTSLPNIFKTQYSNDNNTDKTNNSSDSLSVCEIDKHLQGKWIVVSSSSLSLSLQSLSSNLDAGKPFEKSEDNREKSCSNPLLFSSTQCEGNQLCFIYDTSKHQFQRNPCLELALHRSDKANLVTVKDLLSSCALQCNSVRRASFPIFRRSSSNSIMILAERSTKDSVGFISLVCEHDGTLIAVNSNEEMIELQLPCQCRLEYESTVFSPISPCLKNRSIAVIRRKPNLIRLANLEMSSNNNNKVFLLKNEKKLKENNKDFVDEMDGGYSTDPSVLIDNDLLLKKTIGISKTQTAVNTYRFSRNNNNKNNYLSENSVDDKNKTNVNFNTSAKNETTVIENLHGQVQLLWFLIFGFSALFLFILILMVFFLVRMKRMKREIVKCTDSRNTFFSFSEIPPLS